MNKESSALQELSLSGSRLLRSNNHFGFKLFKEIVKEEKDKNVFISPLSISMVLGMVYNGASGETQQAMRETLGFSGLTIQEVNENYKNLMGSLTQLDPKVEFQIANSIWSRRDIDLEKEFADRCWRYFRGLVHGLDFKDPKVFEIINTWVDENTNGKIKKILDFPIGPLAVMFLINAVYFKGIWACEFDEELTKDDRFNLPDGTKESCRMMERGGSFSYFANGDFQAVDLPYGDGNFVMTIFLPRPTKSVDLLVEDLDKNQMLRNFSGCEGVLYFPKFMLEYELELNNALETLGMGIAFDPYRADFTKICKSLPIWIDVVKHKTYIKVDEEGTEAAAVTALTLSSASCSTPFLEPFEMRVDRPFLFLIRERISQTILFMGKVVVPTSKIKGGE